MQTHLVTRFIASTAAVLALGGCASTSEPTSPAGASIDLSAALSALSIGDVNAVSGVRGLLSIPALGATPTIVPAACSYSSATRSFVCPPSTAAGVTYTASYFLYDAAANPQSQLDLLTTSSVRALIDASGATPLPTANGTVGSVAVTRHADLTLSGLQMSTRTLNGTTSEHDDVTTTGNLSAHSVIDLVTTSSNVVLPLADASAKWPLSGTLTTKLTSATTVPPLPAVSGSANAVVTFNGTSIVTVVVTVSGIVRSCRVDLAGVAQPSCS